MNTNLYARFLVLLASVASIAAVASVASEQAPPTMPVSRAEFIRLGTAEQSVRLLISTCTKSPDELAYLIQLSDRYLRFLTMYGRVNSDDFQPAPPVGSDPACPENLSPIYVGLQQRDQSIAQLLPDQSPPLSPDARIVLNCLHNHATPKDTADCIDRVKSELGHQTTPDSSKPKSAPSPRENSPDG